jgi:PAS domain S-box-containing protein
MAFRSGHREEEPGTGRVARYPFLTLLILSALVLAGGFVFLNHQYRSFRKSLEDDLASISQVKAQAIATWRRERLKDADIITKSPFFTESARRFFLDPRDEKLKEEILRWLASRLDPDNYGSLYLVDTGINVIQSYPGPPEPLGPDTIHILELSMARGEPVLSDLLYQYSVQGIHMEMAAPIPAGDGTVCGAVLLRIDPYRTLFPLLQSWPIRSDTAETILVREDNGGALYLNELRHRSGTAMNLRSDHGSRDELALAAISGHRGIFEGNDHRGKRVRAYVEEIPGTGWKMAAKVDVAELEAPIHIRNYLVISLLLLLLLFLALLLVAMRVMHQRELYKAKYTLEAEKRALAQHFEYLTKHANDIILLLDGEGRVVEANERALEAYGYSREELLGMEVRDIRAGDGPPAFGDELLKKAGEGVIYETEHKRKDGSVFPVEVSARSIRVDDHIFFQAIVRDITDRRRFQERLEKINACFLGMGEDALANMARITATAAELLGALEAHYTRFDDGNMFIYSTLRAQGFERLSPRNHSAWKRLAEHVAASTGEAPELSGMLRAFPETGLVSGHPPCYYATATAHGRELKGVLGIAFDSRRELGRDDAEVLRILARALSVEEERLAHEEELRDFIDIASHELRHPMTIIKGYADLLRVHHSELQEAERTELFQALGEGVERMDSLVQELLEAARLERRGLSLCWEEIDLPRLIREVVEEMKVRQPGVTLTVNLPSTLPRARADRERVRQVLVILLDNAIKFSTGGSEVEVSAEEGDGELIVRVADRGPGVPEELRERIFDRFFQVEDAMHHSSPGIGMGLYIARLIMNAHGGRIWQEPRPGGGSVFSFSVPLDGAGEKDLEGKGN